MRTTVFIEWMRLVDDMSNVKLCFLLAGQVNLGGDAELPKKGDKHVRVRPSSLHVTSDRDHLVNWGRGERHSDNL